MTGYQIIEQTKARDEAEKWHRRFGKSAELFRSYCREPRSDERPYATGNKNPVDGYLQFFFERLATNRTGAIQMHRLVNREAEEAMVESATGTALPEHGVEILQRATDAITKMSAREMNRSELFAVDALLTKLDSAVAAARSEVRAELRISTLEVERDLRQTAGS